MQYRLRTLLIVLAVLPPVLAFAYGLGWVLGRIYARALASSPY